MFQKRRGKSSGGEGGGGKKAGAERRVVNTARWPGPQARPQHGFPWGPPQNHRQHPHGKAGHNWDCPPQPPDCVSDPVLSFFFFFSLKPPHLSSFRRRAPAGVFVLEGCWVIDLLALLFPLAGVSQVVAVNSSEPVGRAD